MRAMVKSNSRLVETLRRIDRALQGPSLAALLFVLLLNLLGLLVPALKASPFLRLLDWLAVAVILAWFVPWLALIFLDRRELYVTLIYLPTLLSPVVWATSLAQTVGEALNRLRREKTCPPLPPTGPRGLTASLFRDGGGWVTAAPTPRPPIPGSFWASATLTTS
jgi:Flp pilus assembly protein TadB